MNQHYKSIPAQPARLSHSSREEADVIRQVEVGEEYGDPLHVDACSSVSVLEACVRRGWLEQDTNGFVYTTEKGRAEAALHGR